MTMTKERNIETKNGKPILTRIGIGYGLSSAWLRYDALLFQVVDSN